MSSFHPCSPPPLPAAGFLITPQARGQPQCNLNILKTACSRTHVIHLLPTYSFKFSLLTFIRQKGFSNDNTKAFCSCCAWELEYSFSGARDYISMRNAGEETGGEGDKSDNQSFVFSQNPTKAKIFLKKPRTNNRTPNQNYFPRLSSEQFHSLCHSWNEIQTQNTRTRLCSLKLLSSGSFHWITVPK